MMLVVAGSTAAGAQSNGRAFRLPPENAPAQRGVSPRPQPQVVVVQPPVQRTVFPRHSTVVYPRQSTIIWVPAVVLADGRIFANFGYGFEQVFRSCSGAVVVGQPTVVGGNGAVLTPRAPTYTQPVPNQQTASQQMAAQNLSPTVTVPAYSTCFSRNGSGGVIVYRF